MSYEGDRLGSYREVKDRLPEFFEKYPDGSIQTELVEFVVTGRADAPVGRKTYEDQLVGHVIVKAKAFRRPDDPAPGTGYSSMRMPGTTPYTVGAELENAETSAVGRALVAVGIQAHHGYATEDELRAKDGARGEGRDRDDDRVVGSSGTREERATGRLATTAMKRKLFAEAREAGLEGDALRGFVMLTVGKTSTSELTFSDMDQLFLTLKDPEKVKAAIDDVVSIGPEPASVRGGD